jgi:uncharacterized HAD superfamily protein/adenine/guanine phosphoribosyltransferase-like PRPP-binding protein
MYYRDISDMNRIILKRLNILPREFDLIVGVPRSGMLPANLLALYLNLPYTDLHSFLNGHVYKAGERGSTFNMSQFRRVLVVDDSVSSGSAMVKVKDLLAGMGAAFEFRFCCVFIVPGKEKHVDYFFEAVPQPRFFQWNIFNHPSLEKTCFDIDGVLCLDPTEEENDDGDRYREFLMKVPPLYIPGNRIDTIVTSRLEKYRPETETWLQKNGVRYGNLVMLDLPNKEARNRANNHAQHKAKTFMSGPYVLFFESSLEQAIEINQLTKKPVFCTENFEMIYEKESLFYNVKSGKYLPFLRNTGLKIRNKIRRWKRKWS